VACGSCDPSDWSTPIALGLLARQAGFTQFLRRWIPHLRGQIEASLNVVGAEKPFGRNAVTVDRADGDGALAWTLPLDRLQAVALVGIVRTAAITLLAAVSGMRSSELMELQVGCCRPPERHGPGLERFRLASKIIKGQPLGGIADEWVIIEPAYRAAQLLEHLHDTRPAGRPCWAGSPSTSATPGSATGSTAQPASASGSPRSPTPRSTFERCGAHWRSNWPTAPAWCSPRNCPQAHRCRHN
jgi:hypothetical protein